jgi:large subunit ribosomal protein L27
LVRQRGTRFAAGEGTGLGSDHTVYAKVSGRVVFRTSGDRRFIAIVPE